MLNLNGQHLWDVVLAKLEMLSLSKPCKSEGKQPLIIRYVPDTALFDEPIDKLNPGDSVIFDVINCVHKLVHLLPWHH
jgi:hypothetical protein